MNPHANPTEVLAASAKAPAELEQIAELSAVAAQDRDAFDRMYRDYYPRLMDFLARIVGHGGFGRGSGQRHDVSCLESR